MCGKLINMYDDARVHMYMIGHHMQHDGNHRYVGYSKTEESLQMLKAFEPWMGGRQCSAMD